LSYGPIPTEWPFHCWFHSTGPVLRIIDFKALHKRFSPNPLENSFIFAEKPQKFLIFSQTPWTCWQKSIFYILQSFWKMLTNSFLNLKEHLWTIAQQFEKFLKKFLTSCFIDQSNFIFYFWAIWFGQWNRKLGTF
jgi:hypothetical protein